MGGVLIAFMKGDRVVLAGTHRVVVAWGDLGFRTSLSTLHIQQLEND